MRIHFIFLGEIDKCLKKVTEGIEVFDDIWQKVNCVYNVLSTLNGIVLACFDLIGTIVIITGSLRASENLEPVFSVVSLEVAF